MDAVVLTNHSQMSVQHMGITSAGRFPDHTLIATHPFRFLHKSYNHPVPLKINITLLLIYAIPLYHIYIQIAMFFCEQKIEIQAAILCINHMNNKKDSPLLCYLYNKSTLFYFYAYKQALTANIIDIFFIYYFYTKRIYNKFNDTLY